MYFSTEQIIVAVCYYDNNYESRQFTKWTCQSCRRENPRSERACLTCGSPFAPDTSSEQTAFSAGSEDASEDEGESETERLEWGEHCRQRSGLARPFTHVRDVLNQQFLRLHYDGTDIPADIVAELKSDGSASGSHSALEERMLTLAHEHALKPLKVRDNGERLAGPACMDAFRYLLQLLDQQGLNSRLLAELWSTFPNDAKAMALPASDEVVVEKPESEAAATSDRNNPHGDASIDDSQLVRRKGVSLRDVARRVADFDPDATRETIKRWHNSRKMRLPAPLGRDPADNRLKLYSLSSILEFVRILESLPDEEITALSRVLRVQVRSPRLL